MKKQKEIYTALLSPFTNGQIDESSLKRLIDHNIDSGISGFYACGSTGEAFLQNIEKRMEILEIISNHVAGRAKIIVQIGAISTDLTIELGKHAIKQPSVEAVSSIPPFYYPFNEEEIITYYLDIAETLDFDVVPYNFPNQSGVALTPKIISRLRQNSHFTGIKFTSNNFYHMERIRNAFPEMNIYNGFDEMLLAGLVMGADGAIGSTFNYIPNIYVSIIKAFEHGDIEKAMNYQRTANDILEAMLICKCFIAAQKYMVTLIGIPYGEPQKPFLGLSEDEKVYLTDVYHRFNICHI